MTFVATEIFYIRKVRKRSIAFHKPIFYGNGGGVFNWHDFCDSFSMTFYSDDSFFVHDAIENIGSVRPKIRGGDGESIHILYIIYKMYKIVNKQGIAKVVYLGVE